MSARETGTTRGSFEIEVVGSDTVGWKVQPAPKTVFFHTKTRAAAMRRRATMESADALLAALEDLLSLAEKQLDPDRTRLFSGELVRAREAIAEARGE